MNVQPRRLLAWKLLPVALVAVVAAGCSALASEDHPASSLPAVVQPPVVSPRPVASGGPGASGEPGHTPAASQPPQGGPGGTTDPGLSGAARGYERYEITEGKVTIDIPTEWKGVVGKDIQSFSDLPALKSAFSMPGADMLEFLGIDLSPRGTRTGTNVLMMVLPDAIVPDDLGLFARQARDQFQQTGIYVGRLRLAAVSLPLGPAWRIWGYGQPHGYKPYFELFLVRSGNKVLLLYCTGFATQRAADAALFGRIARTLAPSDGSEANDSTGSHSLTHLLEGVA